MSFLEIMATAEQDLKNKINQLPNKDFGQSNVQNILNTVYAMVGLVAVGFIVYGAVQYITAGGDAGKLAKAKNAIMYSVVGLLIVLLAAAITNFVIISVAGAK